MTPATVVCTSSVARPSRPPPPPPKTASAMRIAPTAMSTMPLTSSKFCCCTVRCERLLRTLGDSTQLLARSHGCRAWRARSTVRPREGPAVRCRTRSVRGCGGAGNRRERTLGKSRAHADAARRPRSARLLAPRLGGDAPAPDRHLRIGFQAGVHGLGRRRVARQSDEGLLLAPAGARATRSSPT